jgi:hypothetical protein
MTKIDRLEKQMKKVDEEVNEYIHEISDIKVPTDEEFNKHKKRVKAKVISLKVYLGFTNSEDLVYDVIFEYDIKNIIYKSRMQTKINYEVGSVEEVYYFTKNPEFIREIDDESSEPYILEIVIFILLLITVSLVIIRFL